MARMRDHMEATHMNSSEGEKVELKGVVRLEGVVEVRWWRGEAKRREGERGKEAGEGRWGWVGGISLGEWCYTTVCACNTDNLLKFCSLFLSPASLPFQGWLCDVESMMHVTLKDILRACRIDLKKHLNKRDKWIRDWPGQVGKETDF